MFNSFQLLVLALLYFSIPVKSERLFGLLQDLVDQKLENVNISAKCEQNLIAIRNGLNNRSVWALKLLDASGHAPTDFVWGNNMFTGSPIACNQANKVIVTVKGVNYVSTSYPNLTEIVAPFPVAYRAAHAQHKSKLQLDLGTFEKNVVDFGFCMPISCNDGDAEKLLKMLLRNDTFINGTLIGPGAELLQTKIIGFPKNFIDSPFVKIFLIVVVIIIVLVILQFSYEMFKANLKNQTDKKSKHSIWTKVLSCFSIKENCATIVSSKSGKNSIKVLQGLKFEAMNLICIAHVGLFGNSALTNFQHLVMYVEQPWLQLLHSVHLSVETFFTISATLFAYIFFEYVKENKITNSFTFGLKAIVARYLRLTPSYAIQILFIITIDRIIKVASPFYLVDDCETKCSKYWWHNFLYINSFMNLQDMCLVSSYFLATDFQLFLISLVLLLIMKNHKFFGLFLFGSLTVACFSFCGYLAYEFQLKPVLTDMFYNSKYYYTPFWSHIGPYVIGLITGWYLSYKNKTLPLSMKCISILWMASACALLAAAFVHIKGDISATSSVLYILFVRVSWGLGIAWMIVATATRNAGLVGRFLCSKTVIVYGRITYSAYLVHPIMIRVLLMFNEFPLRIDYGLLIVQICGYLVCVYLAAFIYTILFEVPFVRLFKLLI